MIPRRVYFAVLFAFLLHGVFILTVRYRLSYDAYNHMLFADHYASNWFSLWEPRWYAGFTVVSYPPLTHQLIALFIPVFGFEKAYALILWAVTTLFPLGMYAFSKIFIGRNAASYAALASAFLLPIFVTAHIFGQLPFLTATLFSFFNAAALAKFLREGGTRNFLLAVSCTATTMAAHHATLMIQPFFIFAIAIFQLNKNNWKIIFTRLGAFALIAIPASLIVIWPFWKWGMNQQMQMPIDHLSRHNFIDEAFARNIFFWPFYFPLIVMIPFIFFNWGKKFLGLQFSFILLFILGLGGTTQLPALLFGKGWEWLTYDRFAFWASLTLLPFFGILFIKLRRRMRTRFALNLTPDPLRGKLIPILTFLFFASGSVGAWLTPKVFPLQPTPIDMKPIIEFLNSEDRYYWRYITFGFGDQFAYLNLLADKATTIDGSYHTARTIPELRESGIGQIDTAYWAQKGIPAIGPILRASDQYGVRWGFVNLRAFVPELKKSGWVFIRYLSNGIQVWENPRYQFPPEPPIIPPDDPFESFSWGILPMLSLFTTLTLSTWAVFPRAEVIIRRAYTFIVGVIPISLSFWYYKLAGEFPHKQVYFTYDHALFFFSDALLLLAVILWLTAKADNSLQKIRFRTNERLLFALCCLISLSAIWSADWRTSLYISLHFWLIFAFILSLRDWSESHSAIVIGLCAALGIQVFAGMTGFITQSTKFLEPLGLHFPGSIDALSRGASILKLPDGQNILRAYGTFPHPNILGGFLVLCLAGATTLFLRQKRLILPSLLLALGASTLVLTFSRSAWLGLGGFLAILFFKSKFLGTKKVLIAISVIIIAFAVTLIPLRQLFASRTPESSSTESLAVTGRIWLAEKAITFTRERPLTGIGIGSFIIRLAEREGQYNFVEPVHNIPILIISELGVFGFIIITLMLADSGWQIYHAKSLNAILAGALLIGLGVISLLDHYLWTLAPGRIMLALALGLWQGSHES